MRVTRLEIFGFKSFRDRFVLDFDERMIGVVGPNGCGKSNIVDGLRWILGETHAKQLRGDHLEDLIFNGSESKRPLGMAEISIFLQPHEGEVGLSQVFQAQKEAENELLAEEARSDEEASTADTSNLELSKVREIPGLFGAAELQLTRRLYRSGESEYFINRVPCRLKDMIEVYRCIGMGARGMSIVQQGTIGDLIARKPIERRELLEEAAGISGFRARIEAAGRRLGRTRDNIARLVDIMSEVEKQVRTLKRQANRAKQRGELKERLAVLEGEAFKAKAAQIFLGKQNTSQEEVRLEERLRKDAQSLESFEFEEHEQSGEIRALDSELSKLRSEKDELLSQLEREREKEKALVVSLTEKRGKRDNVLESLQRIDRRKESLERELLKQGQELELAESKIRDLGVEKQAADEALQQFLAGALQNEPGAEFEGEGSLELQIREISRKLESLSESSDSFASISEQVRSFRKELAEEERVLGEKRVKLAALTSEIRSLSKQLDALGAHVKQNVDSDSSASMGETSSGRAPEEKVFLEGLKVEESLQKAVSAVLGERANFLVTDKATKLLHSYFNKRAAGITAEDVHVGVLTRSPAGESLACRDAIRLSSEMSLERLIDKVDIRPGFEKIAERLLGHVLLVRDLDSTVSALERAQNVSSDVVFVTETGEVITDWGWFSTQGQGASFSFTRLKEEKEVEAGRLELEVQSIADAAAEKRAKLRGLEGRLQETEQAKEHYGALQRELTALLREKQESDSRRHQESLRQERDIQGQVRRVVSQLASTEEFFSQTNQKVKASQSELHELELERVSFVEQERDLINELEALENKQSEIGVSSQVVGLKSSISEVDNRIEDLQGKKESISLRVEEIQGEVYELRAGIDERRARQSELRLGLEKADMQLSLLREDVERLYGERFQVPNETEIQALLGDFGDGLSTYVQEKDEAANAIRRRIEREGEVDVESIALYEQEQERLDSMKEQHADLESAANTLEKTIRQLKAVSRKRFIDTFEAVSEKFVEIVPRLFGGGAGKMELINPEDPLSSGVDFSVRPPGKRLKSMDLLSGGEKALLATSVLMAMFVHRPSPLCVLDEVDAPLDDANLDRFLAVVREISEVTKSQFLVITHNKQTMAAVDRLIGITMQDSGVSTALSVSLQEAEEELEKWVANA